MEDREDVLHALHHVCPEDENLWLIGNVFGKYAAALPTRHKASQISESLTYEAP